jgi:hypothetical protein
MSLYPQSAVPPQVSSKRQRRIGRLVVPLAVVSAVFVPAVTDSFAAQAATVPVDGRYTIVNGCSDEVLDVAYVSTSDGASTLAWSRNQQQNQQWIVTNLGASKIRLVAVHSGKALAAMDSKAVQMAVSDQPFGQWILSNADADSWMLTPGSSPDAALARPSRTSNEPLLLATKTSDCTQRWKFELLAADVAPTTSATPIVTSPTNPAVAPTTHNHTGGGGNAVLPAAALGLSYPGTKPETTPIKRPSGDSTGNFRAVCQFSHMNYDDPIVHPGKPGAAHLHTYFGNVGARFDSTGPSLLATGNSTCDGGTLNRSSYWIPTIMAADGTPIVPDSNMIYYKSGYQGIEPQNVVQSLPNGLKMVAGNPSATTTAENSQVAWSCSTLSWRGRQGTIPSCPEGETLKAEIQFPQCWNGRDLSAPDLVSHVAYGQWSVGCPASHPVGLPSVSFNITWPVPRGGTEGWHISSDKTPAGRGVSLHGDVILAWDPATAATWLNNCVRQSADCNVGQITDSSRLISGQRQ